MMTTLNSDKLGKLLALASSDNDHEALNALRMAKNLLTGAGMDFKDVAERMAKPKSSTRAAAQSQSSPPPKPQGYTKGNFTWESKAAYDAYMANEHARFERQRVKYADERAVVIAKYGTVAKATARDDREQTLHGAVAPWLVAQTGCKPKGRWSESLDGWTQYQPFSKASARSVEAIKAALPLPITVPAAIAELNAWRTRCREVELALEDYAGNGGLDLPAELRCEILRHLIEKELLATCIADVILRLEYAKESGCSITTSNMADTVLADLRRLMATPTPPTVAPRKKKRHTRDRSEQMNLWGKINS